MDLSKSIDFLLENAGPGYSVPIAQEILRNITPTEEENLLEQIYQTNFKLVQSYVKPNGYIGSGAHSWGKWGGVVYQPTYLADGEACARLLSNYAIQKMHSMIINFINAMRDEETLRQVFSYIPPEIPRFEKRNTGLKSGNVSGDIMVLMYTMQSMLGYGDDEYAKIFSDVSLNAFCSMLSIHSLKDITKIRQSKNPKNRYPYIETDTYFPCSYHLTTLAYTKSWRTLESLKAITNALNHLNAVMREDNSLAIKDGSKYYGPMGFARPLKPFTEIVETVYRRPLTEIAMLGVGEDVNVIRESAANVREAVTEFILKTNIKVRFSQFHSIC